MTPVPQIFALVKSRTEAIYATAFAGQCPRPNNTVRDPGAAVFHYMHKVACTWHATAHSPREAVV